MAELLVRAAVLEEENRALREENARLRTLPKRPKLAPGGMDQDTDLDKHISGETRAEAGKQTRDTFLSLLKTCAKLGVAFWDYLGSRLKIPGAEAVPWLPDLVRQRAPA